MKFATLLLAMLASTALIAHAQYTAYYLGTLPEGPDSAAYGINNAGTIVGQSDNAGGIRAFSYSGGVMRDLGTLGGPDSWAGAINSAGTIVGYAYISTPDMHAFSYSGGVMTDLAPLALGMAQANGINDAGTIVGFIGNDAFSYSGGVMTDLGPVTANAINSAGTIVGSSGLVGSSGNHAASWSGGVMTDLGPGMATGINSAGTIVGYFPTTGYNTHACSWSGGARQDLGTFGGTSSMAHGINSAGTIVGEATTSNGSFHAFIYSGGVMTDLAPYLLSIGIPSNSRAMAINDNGYIVGWGYGGESGYTARAFLLVPVQSPTNSCSCAGSNGVTVAAAGFTNLHSFTGGDGSYPYDDLILAGSTLYGTASQGGTNGYGTVFAINTNGTGFRTLWNFTGGSDGAYPQAGLTLSGNTLYGTATEGGTNGFGTVFAINTNGTGFRTLWNFTSGSDGSYPQAELVLSGNTLYGTAAGGGTYGYGTVFAVNTNGMGFATLHGFTAMDPNTGVNSDGGQPNAGLILSGNTLYGTAAEGGTNGNGTVFAVYTNGTDFTTLHNFTFFGTDGGYLWAALVLSGNTLYGTAQSGGTNGNGTVFSLNTDGTDFRTLWNFTGGNDGASPDARLILTGNMLYGTAAWGGNSGLGNGTVFALTTNGTGFTSLWNFTGGSDGDMPRAGLILSGNTLYGTALGGGSSGDGTVFALTLTNLATNCLQIQCPNDMVITSCIPVQVFYAPTVTDLVCSNWVVACMPPSGSFFAPNTTNLVNCIVTDCCGYSNSCSFTVTVLCTNPCVPAPSGMTAWWTFDEAAGRVANDIAGLVNNQGTYVGNPTPTPGEVGNALCFDGTNDYVLVTNQNEINFMGTCTGANTAESFTIDAWVRLNSNGPDYQALLGKQGDFDPNPYGYGLSFYEGSLSFEIDAGSHELSSVNSYSPDLRDSQWHFIAVTVARCSGNGNGCEVTLYVDGVVVSAAAFSFPYDINNSANLVIGQPDTWQSMLYSGYSGCLDELEFFKRVLSVEEIESIYNAGSGGKCKWCYTNNCIVISNLNAMVITSCVPVQVSYSPVVTDFCCTNWTVVCNPPSGSLFNPDTTNTVICNVTDGCGSSNSCSFTVAVECNGVTPAPNLIWSGALNGDWDYTSLNWQNGATPVSYSDGGNVTFDDSATGTTSITLNATVHPSACIANNNVLSYTISGSGSIAGSSGLTKNGTGTLTLTGANTYTGNTTVNAGTLAITTASFADGTYFIGDNSSFNLALTGVNAQLRPSNMTLGTSTGATIGFDLGSFGNPAVAPLNIIGNLAVNGSIVVNITGALPQVGEFPLIQYGGTVIGSGTFTLGTLPAGVVASIVTSIPGFIDLRIISVPPTPQSLVYQGLTNNPLGNATLTLSSNSLTVGNLGSSGQDGVSIALPSYLVGLDVGWQDLDPSNTLPIGAYIEAQAVGTANGITNGVLGTVTVAKAGTTNYHISADYSPLGASTYTVRACRNGVLVAQATNLPGALLATCDWLPPTHDIFTGKLDWPGSHPTDLDLAGGPTVTCDELFIIPEHVTLGSALTAFQITASQVPAITITCENTSLMYQGMTNTSLGNATLTVSSNTLTVGNLGTNGQDGVFIALPSSLSGLDVSWQSLDESNTLPVGAYIQAQAVGTANGITNGVLDTVTVTKAGTTNYHISADYSPLGASHYTVQAYRNGVLVAQAANLPGSLLATCTWVPPDHNPFTGELTWNLLLGPPDNLAIAGGPTVTCDRMLIIPENVTLTNALTAVQITASQVPALTITSENASLAYGGLTNTSLGNATVLVSGNQLTVANIGSSGQDGMSISLPCGLSGLEMDLQPLDDSNTLPFGAYVQEQAVGTANGIANGGLGTVAATKAGISNYVVSADFSPLGASNYMVQAYLQGVLVAQATNQTGATVANVNMMPLSFDIERVVFCPCCPPWNFYLTLDWDHRRIIIIIPGHSPLTCDQLFITPENVTLDGAATALRITASQVPSLSTTATVSPLRLNLRQTGPNVTLQWFGTCVLQTSSDLKNWSAVSGATAPYTVPMSGTNQFFRVMQVTNSY